MYWATHARRILLLLQQHSRYQHHVQDQHMQLQAWSSSHYVAEEGLFYQTDTADGGEDSISGDGCRVSINAAMVTPRQHRPRCRVT